MARKRERWRPYQGRINPFRLVFVDKTSAKTNMTRTHGRALRGQRLVAIVSHGRWTTLRFMAGLRSESIWRDKLIASSGSINALAASEGVSSSYVSRLLKFSFLAPSIVADIIDGNQPSELTASKLALNPSVPSDWTKQLQALGFR